MRLSLSGRVVVVTGGNRGIGLGLARGVARAGASVAVWARDRQRTEEAVAELQADGGHAVGIHCDISKEESVESAMAETLDALGRLDTFIANAGVGGTTVPFAELTLSQWNDVMRVNLDGTFLCMREAARRLIEQGEGGCLLAVSSITAIHGGARKQHYGATKAGITALMRGLAVELARHKIRCNSLLPGWVDTEMWHASGGFSSLDIERMSDVSVRRTPVRRWGTPEDFEACAVFLADPSVPFHTGDTVVVDGGYSIF